jgi:hypothetical protein
VKFLLKLWLINQSYDYTSKKQFYNLKNSNLNSKYMFYVF